MWYSHHPVRSEKTQVTNGSKNVDRGDGIGPQHYRDNKCQRRLRLQQSWYRDQVLDVPYGVGPQEWSTRFYGNMLTKESAEAGRNFLTPRTFKLAKNAVERLGLVDRYRLLYNMLTSQALCFNLFGELACDLQLATRALADMSEGRIARVRSIDFEFSPGRGNSHYTGDRSAFDVYVQYETPSGGEGFAGIEVKYHEKVSVGEERTHYENHSKRYNEIALRMGCFREARLDNIRGSRLQQIWRDHLLMGAHKDRDGFKDAIFVFLYPEANSPWRKAVEEYRQCLSDTSSFLSWTLEDLVKCLTNHSSAEWIRHFRRRYLDFSQVDEMLASKRWR